MKNLKTLQITLMVLLFLAISISCNDNKRNEEAAGEKALQMQSAKEMTADQIYRASITSLNSTANGDREVSGNVTLEIQGDQLRINVEASGLEPNMMHLQHLHGSKEGNNMRCPDSAADTNNDNLIDITEAYGVAGVTMIPFHGDPVNMEVESETYPTADANGNISYEQTLDLNALKTAFNEKFEQGDLDFSKFTYLVHGVSEDAVPQTAGSVKGLPAHVTLPVGCAELREE